MNTKIFPTFDLAIRDAGRALKHQGMKVDTGHWQGVETQGKPDLATIEVLNHCFSAPISPSKAALQADIKPNLPWAEDHFHERIGGVPLNPGVQWENWPYSAGQGPAANRFRTEDGQFTHTYMERIWTPSLQGIRYEYGNASNLIELMVAHPNTRQAFLPIWFPEDTGAVHGGRVPCTLGYHFMQRNGYLHMWYPIRACDFVRHFRDDIYMACRFSHWLIDQLRLADSNWDSVQLGVLNMEIYSLHIFAGEAHILEDY